MSKMFKIASTTMRFATSTIACITVAARCQRRCGISGGWQPASSRGTGKEFWTLRAGPASGCARPPPSALSRRESISRVALDVCRDALPHAELHCGPAEKLPFADGQFDFVSCLGALEHFLDPTRALREMVRVATPVAEFLLLVPNADFPPSRLGLYGGTDQSNVREVFRSLEGRQELSSPPVLLSSSAGATCMSCPRAGSRSGRGICGRFD